MASRRKSTTPCMVLASEQDPDLELISDLDEGPPVLTPVENTRAESISSDEEVHESVDSDNQQNKKVEGGYECKYCTFQTPDLNMFTFHVDSEHPNVVLNSSYVCVECNFLTKRYDALSEHNLKYHPGEENFKLTMVKRNNQTIFEQTINDLTFDGSFVKEENSEQAEPTEVSSSGISISKTPIMKMMKNKVENKRITVHHNSVEDIPEDKENEIKPDREETVENPSSSASESNTSTSIVNRIHPNTASTVMTPAAVLPGLAQVITAVSAQQNSNLIPKVLIPVNSIPTYNAALDNNPLLLNTYNKFPYPTMSEITVLSAQAKYTEEQIKIWFSAQRLKHGVSWTPEEVEEARRKQFNGTVHTVPQTITVIPTHISTGSNGLPSILQTCQIVGQPGLVLTQVAGANPLPVTAPIALTVAGVPNQTNVQKSQAPAAQPIAETKPATAAIPPSQLVKHETTGANPDSFGIRAKKTKEQLAELKVSYLKNQFPHDSEIIRLMKITGLTKGEIKKWFSDTRYNQRNSKSNQCLHLNNDSSTTIIIDSSDETTESPTVVTSQPKQSWNPFPDFTPQKFKEKTAEQLRALQASFLNSSVLTDEELNRLRAQTKLTRREIDAWFTEKKKSKALKEEKMEVDENNAGSSKEEPGETSPRDESGAPKPGNTGKICKKTPEQLHMLKSAFVRTQWPSPEEYDKLAEESGLARTDIVSWFGDTRYAWKNGNLKWYYYYQSANSSSMNGLSSLRKRGRGRPKGRGRGRPRGRPRGSKRMNNWDRGPSLIKFKTGTAILKDYYLKHKFLNEQDLDELVNKSHMGYEQVREWFAERQRRSELGMELFEENEEEDEVIDDQEEDEEETDDSDTWEPPRHVKRKLSKSDD
ncbi:zinc fingers and homeoboxes protein 1 isoform 1-T3 [Lycaon pictus]|uniref:Zinc fingers and homeoboxes protein 1 n=3 Tax=Canis lupus TaxID=9612 RepID=A0A8I3NE92_CANLF|nr:zinc fingers and homeoboxes protein 1 [Canis lupus familiaris]XP_022282390.1 zinc fingers and homeoboxes protein 1 [Canis lupus familiaris]XP_025306010.1 zinc fingers and homeoboxes protein 1 [Canis lupus dingo]XP_025306012.1 zinc fingers and homeoboxes protein 1 [Canis lupus dingo]XP_038411364.1 zinc fingers and homeoboxes protein 1 [Canis lupus familiaris]XP_038411365.1 zinc fingers and homeoboxes protein 1 [Canis lupus familiaris]XP_038411366.1 zinc fingers and homeoboxes protein 1 [Can|eukprot:XP_022282389.1 zinc fingers and homeoboxes protein 1 [Canis lupus familiaris]